MSRKYLIDFSIPKNLNHNKPKVLIINTGGTFGFVQENPEDHGTFPTKILENYLIKSKNSALCKNQEEEWFIHDFWQFFIFEFSPLMDSSNIEIQHWNKICEIIQENYLDFEGFIILHGTNTMAYTASALSFMIKNLTKPIILTGSMIPLVKGTIHKLCILR